MIQLKPERELVTRESTDSVADKRSAQSTFTKPALAMQGERFLSRSELALRWSCSGETVKRRTRDGILHPLRFNRRFLRYRLSEVQLVEQHAEGGAR